LADIFVNILGDGSKLKGELDKSSKNVSSFSEKIGKIGKIATVAGAAVTAAFTAIVLKTAAVGDQFDKMSLRTGVAVEDLSSLAYTASICGTDVTTLENSLRFLAKGIKETSDGAGIAKDAFEELGISVIDIEGNLRPTVDVMKETATKLAAMDDETRKVALAGEIFGSRYGSQLLPMLKIGGEGIEELMEKAKELGITMSTEAATKAAEFTDAMTDLKGSLAGAGRMIGDTLIPAITPFIEKATEIVVKIKEWAEENRPLVENIFKWAAGLGLALAVIGPILMLLPALITGISMLSGAFLPFLIGGAIIAGLIKINSLLDDMNKNVYKAQINLNNLSVAEIDAEIESLAQEIKRLEEQIKITSELPLATSAQFGSLIDMKNAVMNYEMKLGLLIERRYELTKAEKEGIDVTEEKLKVDNLIAEGQETVNKLLDEWNEKLKIYTKYTNEATESGVKLLDGMYRYTQVANQWKQVSLYFMGVRDSLKAVEEVTDEVTISLDLMEEATGKVYNKWYELGKLYEVSPDLQAYFNRSGEAAKKFGGEIKKITFDWAGAVKESILTLKDTLQSSFESLFYNILSGTKTFGESIKSFFTSMIDAILQQIARLAASWIINLIFPGGGLLSGILGFSKGGGVGYQFGGSVDTIPARLTLGEYVIDKPMTDFIKRFKMIPQNLVNAVVRGLPTPAPAFAGGGPVGISSISAQGFGETKINIDIHDNRIGNDVDVKRLAVTISDEVLRKIELKRRH